MAERDRYLVTFYQRTPETKPIMHAYGPYTALEAARAKGSLPEEHVARGSVLHQRVVKAIWADPRTGIIREEPDD